MYKTEPENKSNETAITTQQDVETNYNERQSCEIRTTRQKTQSTTATSMQLVGILELQMMPEDKRVLATKPRKKVAGNQL